MEPFEQTLRRAGGAPVVHDNDVRRELEALSDARARIARRRPERVALPGLIVAGGLLLGGAGAVAATQFGPWTIVADPDYVVTREWHDAEGAYLGACESHVTVEHASPEAEAAALGYLAHLDLDTLQPQADEVAGELFALGRTDDYARLLGGPEPDWSTFSGDWSDVPGEVRAFHSDARILQTALLVSVHVQIADHLQEMQLDPDFSLTGEGETHCSTDPGPWPASE